MVKLLTAVGVFVVMASAALAQYKGPVQSVSTKPPADTTCTGVEIALKVSLGSDKGKTYCCTKTGGACVGTCWESCDQSGLTGGVGIDIVSGDVTWDPSEIAGAAWGDSSAATFIMNFLLSGGTDPRITFGNGKMSLKGSFDLEDGAQLRLLEPAAGGTSFFAFGAGALAANRICTVRDAAEMIPDSCVEVATNHLDAMTEIAAGIKRGPGTDTHLLTTAVATPAGIRCVEMQTDGTITLAAAACGSGSTSSVWFGNNDVQTSFTDAADATLDLAESYNSDATVYSLNAGNELTISASGEYTFTLDLLVIQVNAANRFDARAELEVDTGGGYANVASGSCRGWGRNQVYAKVSCAKTVTVAVTTGDKFRVRLRSETDAADNLLTILEGTSLHVRREP